MFVKVTLTVSVLQFATVYKARDKTTDTIVAIKKVTSIYNFGFVGISVADF